MQLYSMPSSGNSYKVRLLLALTGQSVERIDCEYGTDALAQARDRGALPFGSLPVLHLDDGRMIPESNAILCHLGRNTPFWPADPVTCAQMMAWLFWEQYSHEPVIAVRQALVNYPHRATEATPARLAETLARGHAALAVMNDRLEGHDWLAGDCASLADIALFAYTHRAGSRGQFDMARFPAVVAWLDRVAALPGHVSIDA